MIEQNQFLSSSHQRSPIISQSTPNKTVNVYFTYQSSPQHVFQQNLKVIKQQQEEKRRKKIFQPRRKLSYQQLSSSKRRSSKLKIFEQKTKRISTMNSPFLVKKKESDILVNYSSGDFSKQNDSLNNKVLKRNNTEEVLVDSLNTAFYEKSPIYLKDSVISAVDTIVDQLQDLQPQMQQKNPINRKLSSIKNKHMKRTFYSNTVKNSLMLSNNQPRNNITKRNRIDSEVLTYHYSPSQKYRSSVTIKATNKLYGTSKFSNGLSILTNNNDINNKLLQDFHDKQDMETPKYHKSAYRSTLRKSYQPSSFNNNNRENSIKRQSQEKRKNILLEQNIHPQTDRFYDQSSIQTPRLPVINKKVSYEVIDPLTSSLKKQKMQRKQLRKISETIQVKKPNQNNKFKAFFMLILTMVTQLVSKSIDTTRKSKESCFQFLKSQLFFLLIIVVLSLAIFAIQLVQ